MHGIETNFRAKDSLESDNEIKETLNSKSDILKLTDDDLILHYRKDGDMKWFEELFNRYRHLVFGVCLKYLKDQEDAKDALVTIFEEMMTTLKKHEVLHFSAWLHAVCRNHCLSRLKKTSKFSSNTLEIQQEDTREDALEALHEKELLLSVLESALDELNELQKQCIRLFYLEEKSYRQIALETALTLNEVKSHIQNGKRNLKLRIIQRA